MNQQWSLPDLCDAHPEKVRVAEPMFNQYGGRAAFWGQISTVICFEDNSLVADRVSESGLGRVLVVDAGGSLEDAMNIDQSMYKDRPVFAQAAGNNARHVYKEIQNGAF